MGLPPGMSAVPVAGIDAGADPELAKAAGEFNAWLQYLSNPQTNDGPRVYRSRFETDPEARDAEFPARNQDLNSQSEYVTVPVLERYAHDLGAFLRPVQAIAGVTEAELNKAYDKLVAGFFTMAGLGEGRAKGRVDAQYKEMHPARDNWMQMRSGWSAPEANAAHEYEGDFITFHVYLENGFYAIAGHLAKYRAIFQKAGEDVTALINALTEKFARKHPYSGSDFSIDFLSVVVTGLVAAATIVISGGAAAPVAFSIVVTEVLGEAIKTAEGKDKPKVLLENHYHLADIAAQYLDGVNRIEHEVAAAIRQVTDNLRHDLERLHSAREYQISGADPARSNAVPHLINY